MTPRAWIAGFLSAGLTGCLVGDVVGIPCGTDDECPSAGFCDLNEGVCVERAEAGAPDVQITGVEGADGRVRSFTSVPVDVPTSVLVHLENAGGYPAEDIAITLSWLRCAPMHLEPATIPQRLDAGERVKMTLALEIARECANPVQVDWFVRFSGREHRGVFELFHQTER